MTTSPSSTTNYIPPLIVQQYLSLLERVLQQSLRDNRTGIPARSLFGAQMRFDLQAGFPALTTKKLHLTSIIAELLWFLQGDTTLEYLHQNRCTIWDEWADSRGNLGPIYGKQWRAWQCPDGRKVDQIAEVLRLLKHNPNSRRILLSAWNPADLPDESISPQENVAQGKMALAACHTLAQFHVAEGRLSCQFYARSQDLFLGTPFNIASYALLTHILARASDLAVGELVWVGGDVHLYANHEEQARQQLTRQPRPLPQLKILRRPAELFEYEVADFVLEGYDPHPPIAAPVAV